MSPALAGGLAFAAVLGLMAVQVPVGIAMLAVGFLGFGIMQGFQPALAVLGSEPWHAVSNHTLAVMPMFILMGNLAGSTGLAKDLFRAAYAFMGHRRGGLAIASIGACAGFGMICGSSLATVATMGQMAMPEMRRKGYSPALSTGAIAAGGTLGIIIPPSVILVVYAFLTEQSIQALFLAALLPGVLATTLYVLAVRAFVMLSPNAGPRGERMPASERIAVMRSVWPVFAIFAVIMGGLYGGVFTANECAAVGVVAVGMVGFVRRQLNRAVIVEVLWRTATTVGMLYLIIIGAGVFNYLITVTQLPFVLVELIKGWNLSPLGVLAMIMAIYIVLGCLMDSMAMLLLTIPLFFPLIVAYGFDPVWFGIVAVVVVELGAITPPVGMNIFIIRAIAPDVPMTTIWRGVTPFVCADLVRLSLLVAFPIICLWLPRLAAS